MSKELEQRLRSTLVKGVGVQVVKAIAAEAAQDVVTYNMLVKLVIDGDMHTRMKSSWALAKATEANPSFAASHIDFLMVRINEEAIQGVLREIFKTLASCTIPEKHEGAFIDICFKMLRSVDTDLAVKYHAKIALTRYTKKYPELKNEFVDALQSVANAHTEPWRKQVLKSLVKLEKV